MDVRGLPLLSGPVPFDHPGGAEDNCRKCNKEFNVLFTRPKRCNHCGYSYCSSCSDYQALMPRTGADPGHSARPVCAFCIEFLNITSSGRGQLKGMPLSKLRKYVQAYNIKVNRAVEKDDLIDCMIAARRPNGCLPPANEEFYRKYSVPNRPTSTRPRGLFSRMSHEPDYVPPPPPPPPPPRRPTYFPRPDLAPDLPQRPQSRRSPDPPPVPPRPRSSNAYTRPSNPPPPTPRRPRTPPTPPGRHSQPFQTHRRPHDTFTPFSDNPNVQGSGNERPHTNTTASAPATPTLDDLLEMTPDSISSLSISTLKAILFTNHVNARLMLEKGELVWKVKELVEEERSRRERQRMMDIVEESEMRGRYAGETTAEEHADVTQEEVAGDSGGYTDEEQDRNDIEDILNTNSAPPPPPKPKPKAAGGFAGGFAEREGLCVVCYDNDANIAIVDCGHLAMCRECSELIMSSSRECPLCRTRIVTESRLLRIFKT